VNMASRILLCLAVGLPLANSLSVVDADVPRGMRQLSETSPSAPPSAPPATIASCFTPYVFNLIMNSASMAEAYGRDFINNDINHSGGRVQLEVGNQVVTLIVLFVLLGVSLLLLLAGEHMVRSVVVCVTALSSFMGFLYLFQWAFASQVVPLAGFVKCVLPFILTCLCALVVVVLVVVMIKKVEWLAFFVMGAAGGAFGMFILRLFILAGNAHLSTEPLFNLYWIAVGVVALIGGFLAVKLRRAVMIVGTCLIGGYVFAVSVCGLVPAFNGPIPVNWVFFVVFGCVTLAGALWQIFAAPKFCPAKADGEGPYSPNKGDNFANVEVMRRP